MVQLSLYTVYRAVTPPGQELTLSVITPTVAPSDATVISLLTNDGSFEIGNEVTTSTTPYTLSFEGSLKCNTTGGNITVNLPTSISSPGKVYCITNTGVNNVIVTAAGGNTVNGGATATITGPNNWLTIVSDGISDWTSTVNSVLRILFSAAGVSGVGSTGTDLFHQNVSNTFQIRKLNPVSSRLSVTYNPATTAVDTDVKTNDAGISSADLWSASQIISYVDTNAVPRPTRNCNFVDDFFQGASSGATGMPTLTNGVCGLWETTWLIRAGTTGVVVATGTTDYSNAIGFCILQTSVLNSRSSICKATSNSDTNQALLYSSPIASVGLTLDVEIRLRFDQLSLGTDRFRAQFGFMQNVTANTAGNFGNGSAFEIDFANYATLNYQCRCRNSVGTTVTDSGVAQLANTWTKFRILLTPGIPNATVQYFINGTLVATQNNANVPNTFLDSFTIAIAFFKTLAAVGTLYNLFVDYVSFTGTFLAPR